MRHVVTVLAAVVVAAGQASAAPQASGPPWINEFHYDDKGPDQGEFVEIAGPAGTDLGGWQVVAYDGKKGRAYDAVDLAGTLPDQQAQVGTLAFDFGGLQNGAPDGLALVDDAGAVVEFLSYEGTFVATDGSADGLQSTDVGASEPSSTSAGHSLQRSGSGTAGPDFTWQAAGPETRGALNAGQVIDVPDATPPAAPTGLTATAGDGSVSLDWDDNGESDLDGYDVHRATTAGGPYSQLNGSTVTSSGYVDTAVTNGTTYYYVVTASDTAGNTSGDSTEAFATPADVSPPAAPTGLLAVGGDGVVDLDWDDNGEPDLGGYDVHRSTGAGGPYAKLNGALLVGSAYSDASVTNDITYYYVVTASDVAGNQSGHSDEASVTPADDTPPAAPTGLTATAGDGSVSLDWDDNGASDLDGYDVHRATTSGGPYGQLNGAIVTSSAYLDTAVTNGTTYFYVVTASDTAGNTSGDSAEVSATPGDGSPPAAPTGLLAVGGDGVVDLDWDDNGEPDLAGYDVHRSTGAGGPYAKLNGALLVGSAYSDASVTNDTTYYYVVTASDVAGNESGDSDETSATPADNTPPAAPTGLAATAGDGSVSLDWDDSGESDLAGYDVLRATTGGGPYGQLNGATVTSSAYLDTAVTNGTTYFYVITASDESGNDSAYSDEASATPQAAGATNMYVASIVPSAVPDGLGAQQGRAVVEILDDLGAPVANAQVTGTFTGDVGGTLQSSTGIDGLATLTSGDTASGPLSFGFCVDAVTHATLTHDPGLDVETCDAFDDPGDPVPGIFYVDPLGDDANPGTSTAEAWQTLQHAFAQLAAGDTLYLRGGTYAERGLSIGAAGTTVAPITVRNYPGEQPVIDGAWPEFTSPGNQAWELVDVARQIWRSVGTYPGAGDVYGYFGPDDGAWRLVPYEDADPFGSDNEDYADTPPYYYIGPGVFWDGSDQRIYYRAQHSVHQIADGQLVPADPDPRQTVLCIFPEDEVINLEGTAAHIVLEGLDVRHGYNAIHMESGAHHVTVRDCNVRGGRYHILVRGGAHDLLFDGVTVFDAFPDWVSWSDVKKPSPGRPGRLFQGSAIQLSDAVDGVEIANGTFVGVFDGLGATKTPSNLHVHHNLFDVRDDVLQLGSAGWNVEFDHNVVLAARSGGPSWNGSGSAPAEMVGTVWVHHNVIDTSSLQRFGRSDPLGLLGSKFQGPSGDGYAAGRTFGRHSKSAVTGPAPWKIYHNTAIVNDDADNGGAGQAYRFPHVDPTRPHEVYNNIFVQVGDDFLLRGARVDDASQIHDGNLYWAPYREAGTELFEDVWNGNQTKDYAALAAFLGSVDWSETLSYYPLGWEASGVEADPLLDAELRPQAGGPAASGAVDLGGKGWPGLAGETFRGALPPVAPPP